jgi:endonuclease G
VLRYEHFSLAVSRSRRVALYTAVNIDGGKKVELPPRGDDVWILDERIDSTIELPNSFYDGNPFDRGHLVRRLDPVWGNTREEAEKAEADTFHLTNSSPQHMTFNRSKKRWQGIENYILGNADLHHLRIAVFSGPVFRPDDPAVNDVLVPVDYWKVVAMQKSDGQPAAAAYLLTQRDLVEPPTRGPADAEFVFGAYRTFQVPVGDIETRTQLRFGRLRDHDTLARTRAAFVELETLDEMVI